MTARAALSRAPVSRREAMRALVKVPWENALGIPVWAGVSRIKQKDNS